MSEPLSVATMSDLAIHSAIVELRAEQQRRAIELCDPDALVELGFQDGFKVDGLPRDPWLQGGVLICPGARIDKSVSSHDCGFARIDDAWVWESESKIVDVVRNVAQRRVQMRSVTLIATHEGMSVDMIYAAAKSGAHRMKSARAFLITDGQLQLHSTRTPSPVFKER